MSSPGLPITAPSGPVFTRMPLGSRWMIVAAAPCVDSIDTGLVSRTDG